MSDVGRFLVEHGFYNIFPSWIPVQSYVLNDIMINPSVYMEPYVAVGNHKIHTDERIIPFDTIRKILQSTEDYSVLNFDKFMMFIEKYKLESILETM